MRAPINGGAINNLRQCLKEHPSIKETQAHYGAVMALAGHKKQETVKAVDAMRPTYLSGRSFEGKLEFPLLKTDFNPIVPYNKGAVVMSTLKEYIGEEKLRLPKIIFKDFKLKYVPYPTSKELYAEIASATPDFMQFLVEGEVKSLKIKKMTSVV